jgi:AraC-like DNA-binding protein
MTDNRLYQRAGLTLGELADEVAATPHEVSQVLSTRLGRNFYTFVNEHRIEHVKTALASTDRPVLDLAFEAGFQSKSTFNTAFRKATGMTPREFRQRPSG